MMHKKSSYQTGRLAKRRRRIFIFRIVLGVIFFVSIIAGTSFWSHSEAFTVSTVKIEESTFTKPAEIETLVRSHLEGNHWFGYARDNVMLLPKGEIEDALTAAYPSVEKVSIRLEGLDTISISFSEYEPVARWCAAGGKDCYFINKKGIIFLKEPAVNAFDLITFYDVISEEPLGSQYISDKFVNDVISFNDLLKNVDLKIKSVSSEDLETFTLVTTDGVDLYIDKSDDLTSMFNNLLAVIDQEAIHKVQFKNIDYIDLRFGNKVIYKLKEWK